MLILGARLSLALSSQSVCTPLPSSHSVQPPCLSRDQPPLLCSVSLCADLSSPLTLANSLTSLKLIFLISEMQTYCHGPKKYNV